MLLKDTRIPTRCGSPGWTAQPHDTSVLVGSYVYFNCRSSFPHKDTVWFHQGKKIDGSYSSAHRFRVYNGKKSLKFGPVRAEDNGAVIGCTAMTSYGPLPSKVGKITVLSKLAINNYLCEIVCTCVQVMVWVFNVCVCVCVCVCIVLARVRLATQKVA